MAAPVTPWASRGLPGGTKWHDHSWQLRLLDRLGLKQIKTVHVDHCRDAWAIVLICRKGSSVVYSGDTRPCERLVQAGMGCQLLIHEATYESSEHRHLALRNKHSLVEEALEVGERMRAERIILTHFSQRHPKAIEVDLVKGAKACVAFDGMHVKASQLPALPSLLPIISQALADDEGDVELGTTPLAVAPALTRVSEEATRKPSMPRDALQNAEEIELVSKDDEEEVEIVRARDSSGCSKGATTATAIGTLGPSSSNDKETAGKSANEVATESFCHGTPNGPVHGLCATRTGVDSSVPPPLSSQRVKGRHIRFED